MTETCDVLVIGSGAAGLATAVTAAHHGARVIVLEKAPVIGGTSAWSGGWLWIPRNPLAVEAGIVEEIARPLEYLRHEIGNRVSDPRIHTFLENGPEMVRFFRDHTAVQWVDGNRIPDFHTSPGAITGGRSICAAPYDGRQLGDWAARLRPPLEETTVWGMGIASGQDIARFFNWMRRPANALHVTRRLGRHVYDLIRHGRGTQLVNGNALIARLMRSARDLGVDIRTEINVTGLLCEGNKVVGASLPQDDIRASAGLVLATGGFPHDPVRSAVLFDHADHHSAAPTTNTGDGLTLAENVGAVMARDLVHPAAWAPVSQPKRRDGSLGAYPHLIDRAKPGFIAVGPDGKRFTNEADSYHDFMSALFRTHPHSPFAWIIADARARRRFGIGAVKPFPFGDRAALASGYLKRAPTLEALARAIDLPAAALCDTVRTFNTGAHHGEDPAFGRGASPYNRIQGDALHGPNPSLGALKTAPYYAVRVVPGSLGTFAGLRTDAFARVLNDSDTPIEGLFAVGNDAASIFGGNYPSGGITLGPAMTFGYIAGRVLTGQPVAGPDLNRSHP